MRAPKPGEAVTLGELMDNPAEAIGRIGMILKRDVSDPKLWLAAAVSYFGPKVISAAMPTVGTALMQAGRVRINPGVQIKAGMSGVTLRPSFGFSLAPKPEPVSPAPPMTAAPSGPLNDALAARSPMPTPAAPTSARPPIQPENLPEAWRQFAGPTPAEAAAPAPTAQTVNQVLSSASSAKVKLSATEVLEGARLVQRGKTPAEALNLIQQMRQLNPASNAEVTATVAEKNARTTPAKGGTAVSAGPVANAPIPVGRIAAIQRAQRISFTEAARLAQEEANVMAAKGGTKD